MVILSVSLAARGAQTVRAAARARNGRRMSHLRERRVDGSSCSLSVPATAANTTEMRAAPDLGSWETLFPPRPSPGRPPLRSFVLCLTYAIPRALSQAGRNAAPCAAVPVAVSARPKQSLPLRDPLA